MARNAVRETADRLGFLAYLTVMGGGTPDLTIFRAATRNEPPREEATAFVRYELPGPMVTCHRPSQQKNARALANAA